MNEELGLRQKIAIAVAKADVDAVMELIQAEVLKARIDELKQFDESMDFEHFEDVLERQMRILNSKIGTE